MANVRRRPEYVRTLSSKKTLEVLVNAKKSGKFIFNMKKILSLASILTLASTATFAAPVKVIKTGGNRAVIEFPKGTVIKAGSTLNLATGEEGDSGSESAGPGGRKNFIGINAQSTLGLGGGGGFSIPALNLQYGMNMGGFEIAPTVGLSKVGTLGFNFSLLADINFANNKVGETFVPAFMISAGFARAAGANTIPLRAGFAGKLFVLRQSQSAIRLEVSFDMTKVTGGFSKQITLLGAGISTYF